MVSETERTLADLRRDGPRRFARWDGALFDAVVTGPARALGESLEGEPDTAAVLTAYLRLVQEGVGTGALRQPAAGGPWSCFLERCLVGLVPALLPKVKAGQRLPLLVRVWNLGEGLRREPGWLDRYFTACAGRVEELTDLDHSLVRILDPVLAPPPPAAWRGPFNVSVLDLRALHDEFLPGEIALAAPTVFLVEDRRHKGLQTGVLLRRGGKSELLGLTEGLETFAEPGDHPAVEFRDGGAIVAGQPVQLPTLRRCHRHAVARAGFVAACAVDSQRLWIVESL
jgi:hypothetical protein